MNVDEKGELKRRIAIAICGLAMWRTSAVLGGIDVLHAPSDREASTSGIQVLRVQQPQGRGIPRKLLALKGILCKMTAPSFCFHPPFTPLFFTTLFGRVANKRSLEL